MESQAALLTATVTATSAFGKLPYELLCEVWLYLDDPGPLVMASKFFHSLSKAMYWRIKWYFARYELYLVMWHALARPKLFTPELFNRLLASGAPVSRNLAQLLLLIRGEPQIHSLVTLGDKVQQQRWAGISDSAYAAIMDHAVSLYGDRKYLGYYDTPFGCDGYFFNEFEHKSCREASASRHLRLLFTSYKFMPLPIQIKAAIPEWSGTKVQSNYAFGSFKMRVEDQPFLAALAVSNGWSLDVTELERFRIQHKAYAKVEEEDAKCAEALLYFRRCGLRIDERRGLTYEQVMWIINREKELRGTEVVVAEDLATQGSRAVWSGYKRILELSNTSLVRFSLPGVQVAKPSTSRKSFKPAKCTQPAKSWEPVKSSKPVKSTQPAKSTQPVKSSKPAKSTKLQASGGARPRANRKGPSSRPEKAVAAAAALESKLDNETDGDLLSPKAMQNASSSSQPNDVASTV